MREVTLILQAGESRTIDIGSNLPLIDDVPDDNTSPLARLSWSHWLVLGLGSSMGIAGGVLWATADGDETRHDAGVALTAASGAALTALAIVLIDELTD
jgi:hypothetical protein